jgi:hypothetical protein
VRLHVFYWESGAPMCFVLWQCYIYTFFTVRVFNLHVLHCESGTSTWFVLWQCYIYMFCIVALLSEKKFKRSVLGNVIQFSKLYILCLICLFCDNRQTYPVNIVTRLGTGRFRYSNRSRGKRLCFPWTSRASHGLKQPPNKWVVCSPLGGKSAGAWNWQLASVHAKIMNQWKYVGTLSPPLLASTCT